MIKNIIATSLVAATLVFSGCGSDEGEAALSVQQKLDQRDFVGAISMLQGNTDTDGEKLQLGSAYMGAAGLSTTDLIRIMSDSTSDTTTSGTPAPQRAAAATGNSDSFARFAEVLQKLADNNPKMLEYLNKATEIFALVSGRADSASLGFAIGLANTAKATTVLTYLGDIETLVNGGATGDLRASSCAITYMYAATVDAAKCTVVHNAADNTLLVTLVSDGSSYLRLVSGVPGQFVDGATDNGEMYIHKNYTDSVTGEETENSNNGLNQPIVVLVDGERITVKDTLVSALNEGFDTIVEFAPDDTKDDILEYKREIDLDNNSVIDSSEIAQYLAK